MSEFMFEFDASRSVDSVCSAKAIATVSETPTANRLLQRVRTRLQTCSFAAAGYYSLVLLLGLSILAILAIRRPYRPLRASWLPESNVFDRMQTMLA